MRRHDECVSLLRDCLAQCLRTVGEAHCSTASVLVNLGRAVHMRASEAQGNTSLTAHLAQLDEAQALLQRALAARRRLLHRRHPGIAECRAELGCAHFKKQEFEVAEAHLTAALRTYKRLYGRRHPDVALWTYWLGKVQLKQQRVARGRESLTAALQVAESLAGCPPFTPAHVEEIRVLLGGRSAPASPSGAERAAGERLRALPDPLAEPEPAAEPATEPAAEPPSQAQARQLARGAPEWEPAASGRTAERPRPSMLLDSPSRSPSSSRSEGGAGSGHDGDREVKRYLTIIYYYYSYYHYYYYYHYCDLRCGPPSASGPCRAGRPSRPRAAAYNDNMYVYIRIYIYIYTRTYYNTI